MEFKLTKIKEKSEKTPKFSDNLRRFVYQETFRQDINHYTVLELMEELPVDTEFFQPLEHWEFRHIFAYESNCDFDCTLQKKHNCLFGRSGFLLYETIERGMKDQFTVSHGYELWLLDDMTFVTVSFHQSRVNTIDGVFTAIYRHQVEISEFDFDMEYFLEFDLFTHLDEAVNPVCEECNECCDIFPKDE